MKAKDLIATLRRTKNLSDDDATQQADVVLGTLEHVSPSPEIIAVAFNGKETIICLDNGMQATYDLSFTAPTWSNPEGDVNAVILSNFAIKQEAQANIDQILANRGVSSIAEFHEKIFNSLEYSPGSRTH